jgi:5-bromo-4-chloroindolyl phosphate hydrolysis protein/nucleoid DNA-binding protein
MDKRNFNNLKDEILDTLQDAVVSMDFTKLKEDIRYIAEDTINEVKDEVKKNFKVHYSEPGNKYGYKQETPRTQEAPKTKETIKTQQTPKTQEVVKKPDRVQLEIDKKPAGSVSSILYMVFGFIGTGLFGAGLIIYGSVSFLLTSFTVLNSIGIGALSLFFAMSSAMAALGIKKRKRLNRFKKYVRQLKGRSFCSIKELSSHIGHSDRFVAKDLRKMIDLGMFPEGHIDEEKTHLMLNYNVYEQYLKTKEAMKQREQEQIDRKKAEEDRLKDPSLKELREVIEKGRNYIKGIKEANDAIPGIEISNKLYRLEQITNKIFNYVEQHPEKLTQLNKLMNYYLPITLKLVNTYKDLDMQPVQGENIKTAKSEIEDTLDTIVFAFEKLLDDLFKDIAFDISADISVLETMLSREGLTERDFKKMN